MTQEDLAREAEMKQPRISAMERPGETQFNLETLIRLAAVFKVGLIVRFASYSEMLRWENEFSQDTFDVVDLEKDTAFLQEAEEVASPVLNLAKLPERYRNVPSGGLTDAALSSSPSAILGIRRDVRLEPVRPGFFPGDYSSLGQTL
jgi:transcriptional regulator with XRE-family HTH domain